MLSREETSSPRRAAASPGELVPSALSNLGAQVSQRLAWESQGPENCFK